MAMTKSSAGSTPMPPSPWRFHSALKPWACASDTNCQLSHSSDSTTRGRATRAISLRTSCTIDPLMSSITTPPHSSVASTGHWAPCKLPDCCPIATVASRITTSSNVPQPTSCTMFSTMGRLAKPRPYTACISPALARPLSHPSLATQPSSPAPSSEPATIAHKASWVPSAGIR